MRIPLIIAILLVAGCGKAEWHDFRVPEGEFTVLMPGIPKRTMQQVAPGITNVVYESRFDSQHTYAASFMDIPNADADPANIPNIMHGGRDELLKQPGFTLVREKNISFQRLPGLELQVKNNNDYMLGLRYYVKGDRFYQLLAIQSGSTDPFTNAETLKFFESFRPDGTSKDD